MRRWTLGAIYFMVVAGIANLLQSLLLCRMHDGILNISPDPTCAASVRGASFVATGLFNGLTNLAIGLLPLYTIWSLRTVSVSTRLGLTAVFMLGIRCVVALGWLSAGLSIFDH